jgi:hypothetical protein
MALYDYNSSVNCYVSARSFLLANDVFVYRTLEIYVSGRISGCWLQSGLQMIGTSLSGSTRVPSSGPVNLFVLFIIIGGRESSMARKDCSLLHTSISCSICPAL